MTREDEELSDELDDEDARADALALARANELAGGREDTPTASLPSHAVQPHPYESLKPEVALDALESVGYRCDGRLLALNSYENRVYLIGLEDGSQRVAKFYRPERWTDTQILEEHRFVAALHALEIPAVPALPSDDGATLFAHAGFRFAVFERKGGRAPELESRDTREWLGRFLGRIHALGVATDYVERPALDRATFGIEPRDWIVEHAIVPPLLAATWRQVVDAALDGIAACDAAAGDSRLLRLHGDCHLGNVLWTDGPHFVDFDDSRMGPALQDLWMLLSGTRDEMTRQLADLLEGYAQFMAFDARELHRLEALRTLRMIHYSAWLARRWDDPAFPAAFPFFGSERYWNDQIDALREQLVALEAAPLSP
jgi:Ser/Thr protein kinase RdoA (MazF antagonist)